MKVWDLELFSAFRLMAPNGVGNGFDDFGRGLFLVRGMEVEINAAEGTVTVGLAEDDGELAVERDTVAKMRASMERMVPERERMMTEKVLAPVPW